MLLPGDNGTWAVGLVVAARDPDMRALREPEVWQRAAALFPPITPWAAGTPFREVLVMSGSESRAAGGPGMVNVGDAWATTNPTFGLGMTMGVTHAVLLGDIGLQEPEELIRRLDAATGATLPPIYQRLRAWDEHRLAELEGVRHGLPYDGDDPSWAVAKSLDTAKLFDGDLLRAMTDIAWTCATPEEVLSVPGRCERIATLGGRAPFPRVRRNPCEATRRSCRPVVPAQRVGPEAPCEER
ncbi:hypothetical protein [Nonomuraea solani]|nr:hypothetical protein [Nonomuraea solani]